MQHTLDVDVLCVDSPKAQDRARFLIASEVLAAGCVPALETESSGRGLAVCLDGRCTQSDIQVAGRGSYRVVRLPWGAYGAVYRCL